MVSFWIASFIVTVVPAVWGAPAPPGSVGQLEQLKSDDKLEVLQEQLQRLQAQLLSMKGGDIKQVNSEVGGVDGSTNGVFYDKPVRIPEARVHERQIGWQPLRRGLNEKDETLSSKFQLSLKDSETLKSQLLEAVERHLLDDLATAQRYGIEPRVILDDLRQKNRNSDVREEN